MREVPANRRGTRRRRWAALVVGLVVAVVLGGGIARLLRSSAPPVHTGSPAANGATIVRYEIRSRFVHQTLPQTAASPTGDGRARPLLVFLHGRGGNGNESNSNADFYAALRALRDRAPDVVFPSGGDHSYFHRRGSGDWGRYVLDEVIPQAVRHLHADARRVAIGGISMGGFGAYDIARLRPSAFCAVGGHSAAMWLAAGDTAPGAFDDAEDFARNDVVGLAEAHGSAPWGRARLWLDGGEDDPFREADETLARGLGIAVHHWPGGHEGAYWHAHYRDYLGFYASALAAC